MTSPTPQLWATASREWVIPPRRKPGRKSTKAVAATVAPTHEVEESTGRRVQNRASERAFRERKQSQLADLQARVHSYEQGGSERSVVFQSIAQRLKEENAALRRENAMLKAEADQEHGMFPELRDGDRSNLKSGRKLSESPASSVTSAGTQETKHKGAHDLPDTEPILLSHPYTFTTQFTADSTNTDSQFTPVPGPIGRPTDGFSNAKSEFGVFQPVDWAFCSEDAAHDCYHDISEHKIRHNESPSGLGVGAPPPSEAADVLDPPFDAAIWTLLLCENCSCAPDGASDVGQPQQLPSEHCNPSSDISTPSSFARPSVESTSANAACQSLESRPTTDLAMLADFVARRSRRAGSRIVPSPPHAADAQAIFLTDPHAHFCEQERERARRGQSGIREVQADAFQALRILDSGFLPQYQGRSWMT